MPEVQKYNLKQKLIEADKKFKNTPDIAGMSAMTFYPYTNSTRTQMLTSHLNQILNIINPDYPLLFTGMENTAGRNSSGYLKAKDDIDVIKKIVKFEDLVDEPYVYTLFVWDYKKGAYDIIERNEVKDLPENYGYKYNNAYIDALKEGDKIRKGDVIYQSTSYDKYMNYRFGKNLNTILSFEPFTSEDAADISEDASEGMTTCGSKKIRFGWNWNDIPLNIYGDEKEYLPLPWLGGLIDGYVASARPQINEQVLNDMTSVNLRKIRDSDHTKFYNGKATLIDLDIFCNADEIPENSFYHQINIYLEAQTKYWEQIYEMCNVIRKSGKKYTRKVDSLYKRSKEMLNLKTNEKWHDGNILEIRVHVIAYKSLSAGGKFTARYGNKSVTARVRPNYLMPFTKDGRRADVVLHLPAPINRTTAFVIHEPFINWMGDGVLRHVKNESRAVQEDYIFGFIRHFNEKFYAYIWSKYQKDTQEGKDQFIEDTFKHGIHCHLDMIEDNGELFYKIVTAYAKYDFLKPDTMFIYRWGRIYRLNSTFCMGKMYFFPLKQTDERGFSARSTGAINIKGLPERSYKNKRNEDPFSDTAVRFGDYEALNFLIGQDPEEYACMEACYRTSPEATSDMTRAQFVEKGYGQFKKFYKSKAAEMFHVFYKHLGLKMRFTDKDNKIRKIDNSKFGFFTLKNKAYICTEHDFNIIETKQRLRDAILQKRGIMQKDELDRLVEEEFEKAHVISGPFNGKNIFGTNEELTDDDEILEDTTINQ